ncbi:aspartyl/asparaginyl beta-hydroxylase domain-containing protein [Hyalangium gracile]|uniref:aspartyl/asparaginyl beta-hydroxylase domain-containing protein n=1 Tax=Hyalangium gracile TaxID=394092 RepID=UPI001CCD2D52|nr:aspartyl/asparaginyl beta-hydroxylase domain-containing protein [Hyalangium gracile]
MDAETLKQFAMALEHVMSQARQRYKAAELERVEEFVQNMLGMRTPVAADPRQMNGKVSRNYFPGLTARPWHDTSRLSWVPRLEQSFSMVREELESALRVGRGFEEFYDRTDFEKQGWKEFYFYRAGSGTKIRIDFPENQARCPKTTQLIQQLPVAGEAMFASLAPKGYIRPHCSEFNAKLTCHLGLIVPPDCAIRVADEVRTWEEGKCLLFDDTYEHEVWNRSERLRVILLLDVWHPDLTQIEVSTLIQFRDLLSSAQA